MTRISFITGPAYKLVASLLIADALKHGDVRFVASPMGQDFCEVIGKKQEEVQDAARRVSLVHQLQDHFVDEFPN